MRAVIGEGVTYCTAQWIKLYIPELKNAVEHACFYSFHQHGVLNRRSCG